MELIFAKEVLLQPEDAKTNVILPFKVEDSFERLEIHFSYAPKKLDDEELSHKYIVEGMEKYAPGEYRTGYKEWEHYLPVVNLITLSLDSPNGYIGCAHRHNPVQGHTLSEQFSSPGFISQIPVKGRWQAVINVHAVVTETCLCKLEVFGNNDAEDSL